MSNFTNQKKKMMGARLLTTKKITFLIAILIAASLNNSYAQNTWTRKADFGGAARFGAVGFCIGNKGYVGTGFEAYAREYYKDFWEYDPATNTWTQKADFGGIARINAVGFGIGNKGYIGTGSNEHLATLATQDFWEYDPAANTWTQKANFGGSIRASAVGFSIGHKGYIGTGALPYIGFARDFWEYDPTTDTWTQKADFGGVARTDPVGFSIGGKGYIGTGLDGGANFNKDFWEYDPVANTWTRKTDLTGPGRQGAVGFVIGSKGYIGTGRGNTRDYKDFWEYDPVADAWTRKANFGGDAMNPDVGFGIGSKAYIGLGSIFIDEFILVRDFWEYDPGNCPLPVNLRVPKFSDTCAVLTWDITGTGIVKLQVRYRASGNAAWIKQRKDPDRNRMNINGLIPNTIYQWQLRSLCTEDTSGWVKGPDFTTAVSLHPITNARAYPNPARNAVSINYTAQKNGKYVFEITDISGNGLLRKEADALPGANRITLDISRFFKGNYFINIIKPDKTRERIQLNKE